MRRRRTPTGAVNELRHGCLQRSWDRVVVSPPLAGLVLTVVHAAAAQRADDPPPSKPSEKLGLRRLRGSRRRKGRRFRGGTVSLTSYQESDVHKTTVKGLQGTNAPELFGSLMTPTIWRSSTSVSWPPTTMPAPASRSRACGRRRQDAARRRHRSRKSPSALRQGRRDDSHRGDQPRSRRRPAAGLSPDELKVRPGLNTHEVALKALVQPGWGGGVKVDPKKILQKPTASTSACIASSAGPRGMLIVDNVTFEK